MADQSLARLWTAIYGDTLPVSVTRPQMQAVLKTLRPQEADVLCRAWGFGTVAQTLAQIGRVYQRSRGRMGQIRLRAERKMRHPTRRNRFHG